MKFKIELGKNTTEQIKPLLIDNKSYLANTEPNVRCYLE